jgi:glycosyltransferase involved in cell wall biosynthesis
VPTTAYARSIKGYDRFICYSDFARDWVKRRLGVEAEVIAPPVDRPAWEVPRERMPWIVSVGRFFRGGHEKRHDVMIDAFRALGAHGWELHLAGTSQNPGWVEKLRARAKGLAVQFHVDAPREDVLQLYSKAALYWHACGFAVDEERHPERLEHFGIATVEAMMHGAVPLVVPAGGQAAIVQDGINGRWWRSIPELVAATRDLIGLGAERQRMSERASSDALTYETSKFRAAARDRMLKEF